MAYRRGKKAPATRLITGYCKLCGKVRYLTRPDARHAAARMPQRMRTYRCPVDGKFWHLASWQPQTRVAYYRDKEAAG